MSAFIELVPPTRITSDYTQPTDTVVDLSEFNELAVMVTITELTSAGTALVDIRLETAMENRDERFVVLKELVTDKGVTSSTYQKFVYLAGPGTADSATPNTSDIGLGRFIRITTNNMASATAMTFDVKALARQ